MYHTRSTLATLINHRATQAAGEAEAELARLSSLGLIDAVMTDDSDTIIFGATVIIRKYVPIPASLAVMYSPCLRSPSFKRAGSDKVTVYRKNKILESTGLSTDDQFLFALLVGCDYDQVSSFVPLLTHLILTHFHRKDSAIVVRKSQKGWRVTGLAALFGEPSIGTTSSSSPHISMAGVTTSGPGFATTPVASSVKSTRDSPRTSPPPFLRSTPPAFLLLRFFSWTLPATPFSSRDRSTSASSALYVSGTSAGEVPLKSARLSAPPFGPASLRVCS